VANQDLIIKQLALAEWGQSAKVLKSDLKIQIVLSNIEV
jgi:hypothetical protein